MPAAVPVLVNATDFDARPGVPVEIAPGIVRVTAPNSGPYTFTGTNSFILGREKVLLVDPGPDHGAHLAALRGAIGGRPVSAIVLTHTHRDHSALAGRLRAETGAPLCFAGRHRLSRRRRWLELNMVAAHSDWRLEPDVTLTDGAVTAAGDTEVIAIATPGHCANHLCLGIVGTPWMLSGDHVMGWNSTLVSVPDGSMADYLGSLAKVITLPYRHYLPAHGDGIDDGPQRARALLQHRERRNEEVMLAVKAGARRLEDLVRAVYPELPMPLLPAARMTVIAHLEYLQGEGRLLIRRGPFGKRLEVAG